MRRQTDFDAITLKTRNCDLAVNIRTGMLENLRFAGKDLQPWNDFYIPWGDKTCGITELYRRRAGLHITDELTGIEYRDDFGIGMTYYNECRKSHTFPKGTPGRVTDVRLNRRGNATWLTFRKRFAGAPFAVACALTATPDDIRWDVTLVSCSGIAPRSVKIEFALPAMGHPGLRPPWSVWAPVADAPFHFTSPGGYGHEGGSWEYLRFVYANAKGDNRITVPIIDLYSEKLDAGLAVAAPFELHKPELIFDVDKLWSETRIVYSNLGLKPGLNPMASILLHGHAGDWRPGLGWLFEKYRDYFTAGDDRIIRQEGPMSYSFPVLTDKIIKAWKRDMHFSWTEALFAPTFGDYVPKADAWLFDMMKSAGDSGARVSLTRAKMTAYFKRLKKHGVASFAYFNVGECETSAAEKQYPESILVLDHGHRAAEWLWPDGRRRNWRMNPDPDSRWGRAMLRQLDELFRTYPDLDGIFLDQLCYRTYDFARGDGRTMLHNRSCFDTHTVMPRMVARIVKILRKHRRTAFTNGPYCIEVAKGLDGVMSEGRVPGIAQYAYMCLARPVMILTYGSSLDKFEHTLKACLKYGAFPDVRDHLTMNPRENITPEEKDMYARYLPLLEELRGRRWVFHPHALRLPNGYDGNIFKNRRGRYVITIFPQESLAVDRRNGIKREIRLILPDIATAGSARWRSTNWPGQRRVALQRQDRQTVTMELNEYTDASVIVL